MPFQNRRERLVAVAVAASAATAVALHLVAGTAVEQFTGVATGIAVTGTTYLLYAWGQRRDTADSEEAGDESDEQTREREKEMKAEAGGYGGNAGG